jgi:hypothetical protein
MRFITYKDGYFSETNFGKCPDKKVSKCECKLGAIPAASICYEKVIKIP